MTILQTGMTKHVGCAKTVQTGCFRYTDSVLEVLPDNIADDRKQKFGLID